MGFTQVSLHSHANICRLYVRLIFSYNRRMLRIALYFWQMCLLRAGPEKVPASLPVMSLVLAAYLLIAFISANITRPAASSGALLGSLLIGVVVECTLVYGILRFKKFSPRAIPTLISLFGTNAIILLLLLALNLVLVYPEIKLLGMLAESAFWLIFFWWMAIVGYILHKAMNISVFLGVAIAFTLELLTNLASQALFPTQQLS